VFFFFPAKIWQKINQKNTWELGLIDHLSEIIQAGEEEDDETNFQKVPTCKDLQFPIILLTNLFWRGGYSGYVLSLVANMWFFYGPGKLHSRGWGQDLLASCRFRAL
jgi:hypothetical protein